MELVNLHVKQVMEGCKERARAAGLVFQDETLEYIVTNRDLLELTPKMMIPTMYDYWVHDVQVLREKGKYELYPSNPYETVINTRPAISFYNDNNPDWLNVMIFYHVLAHIDFFQNNLFYRHTWDYDFNGQALSDKRMIARLRSQKGRWVDYVIEFARGIDNLVGYHAELALMDHPERRAAPGRLDYYFDVFLQTLKKVSVTKYLKEVERYNQCLADFGAEGERHFFSETTRQYPELEATYSKFLRRRQRPHRDLLQYLLAHSEFLNKSGNRWMRAVLQVVRKTSLFFQPQIRTKIMNEGWASYWHQVLFLSDDRIGGHEVSYARVNALVTAMPRVGLNPYALGMRLFEYIREQADKGRLSYQYQRLTNLRERQRFDLKAGAGLDYLFKVREDFCDFTFITAFLDQEFMDRHQLFVSGRRLNRAKRVWEYYVKSRKLADYRQMLIDAMYHPPDVRVDEDKTDNGDLYLVHRFEGRPLVNDYIANTMLGIEYLWGAPVHLQTHDPVPRPRAADDRPQAAAARPEEEQIRWQRVEYTMKDRKLSKKVLQ